MGNGLTDKQQSVLAVLAYTFGSLGTVTTVISALKDSEAGLVAGVIVAVLGALSIGIKEGLGLPDKGFTPAPSTSTASAPASTAPATSSG